MAPLKEIKVTDSGEREVHIRVMVVEDNLRYSKPIFNSCFNGLSKEIDHVNSRYSYLVDICTRLNKMATAVNAISINKYSPLALAFTCYRRIYGNDYDEFWEHLLSHQLVHGITNKDTMLDIDFEYVFGNKNNQLLVHLNNDPNCNSIDYDNPNNVLCMADMAHEVLPFALCETILFALLLRIGLLYPDTVGVNAERRFKHVYLSDEGTQNVLHRFPGLFTLLCYWDHLYGSGVDEVSLRTVIPTLNLISNSTVGLTRIVRTAYVKQSIKITKIITHVAVEILTVLNGYNMEREDSMPIHKRYARFNLKDYNHFLNMAHFLLSNTFVGQ